eukprot:CAMPEP_0201508640 /NCGR_PEP_ID=MMETSP0161_2-20130828/1943_1 /ASSEMBLY_ACC=CAM_ASM_000251 /TAXON_ID=180227 /ORGANISM="Neoparamoeba aestuarina, Strain SoJaBio B1-5/56/2" /LENGTH=1017 /DNA_ID=CAMNT_0047903369 /DNA_START=197 /DNA_END=3247 /DNA_ORIENTATION=-
MDEVELKQERGEICGKIPSPTLQAHFILLAYREFRDNKLGFCLGFLAITAVVFVAALLASILASAPILFCGLAEDEFGQIDLVLHPALQSGFSFLNYTNVKAELERPIENPWDGRDDAYSYSSPRTNWEAYLTPAATCGSCYSNSGFAFDSDDKDWQYLGVKGINRYEGPTGWGEDEREAENGLCYWPQSLPDGQGCMTVYYNEGYLNYNDLLPTKKEDTGFFCFDALCGEGKDINVYGINTMREKEIDLGRLWDFDELGEGEAYLHTKLAKKLGVNTGDEVFMTVYVWDTLKGLWVGGLEDFMEEQEDKEGEDYSWRWESVIMKFKVKGKFSEPFGKFGEGDEEAVVIEYKHILKTVAQSLHPDVPQKFVEKLEQLNWDDYADEVVVNFPSPRHSVYAEQNADVTTRNAAQFATSVVYRIGAQDVTAYMPAVDALKFYRYMEMFFGLMLDIILFILMFLSILLIYSLLSVSVERRTFSFGILRMAGLLKSDVILMIILQPILSCIPAILLGLLLATGGTYIAAGIFEDMTGTPIEAGLTFEAVVLAVGAGVSVPLLASILPIQGALSRSLTDALDTKRSKIIAIETNISRAGGDKISFEILAFSLALVFFGSVIYYAMPLALVSTNIGLLLNLFFGLIILMLLGLVLLSLNFQHLTEKVCVWGLFWWEKRGIPQVLLKSLIAHRARNRFTAVMYALSIAFIIFISVSYDINVNATLYEQRQRAGADFKITADKHFDPNTLGELEYFCDHHPLIKTNGCTWTSDRFKDSPSVSNEHYSVIGRQFEQSSYSHAVCPNFLNAASSQFLVVDTMLDWDHEIIEQLYTPYGSASMIAGTTYIDYFNIGPMDPFIRKIYEASGTFFFMYTRSIAFLSAAPRYSFSNFPLARRQSNLISLPRWVQIAGGNSILSVDDIPFSDFLIKPIDDLSESSQQKTLVSDMNEIVANLTTKAYPLKVYVYEDTNDSLEKANTAISFFFGFTTVLAMIICFFSLTSSMYTNVRENAKETGILRAIGVPRDW